MYWHTACGVVVVVVVAVVAIVVTLECTLIVATVTLDFALGVVGVAVDLTSTWGALTTGGATGVVFLGVGEAKATRK